MSYKAIPLRERFWPKVDVRGPDDCWEWTAACNEYGYGLIGDAPRTLKAHRVAWELTHNDTFPVGKETRHTCHNRKCCNPAHLKIGTRFENVQDQIAQGTHCSVTSKRRWDEIRRIEAMNAK